MAKDKSKKPIYWGVFPDGKQLVDSYEEYVFSHWCLLLYQNGYIKKYAKGDTYDLSPPVQYNFMNRLKTKWSPASRSLVRGHSYTPDFKILWDDKAKYIFFDPLSGVTSYDFSASFMAENDNGDWVSIVEIKPIFDQNNMTKLAKINIQWTYYRYNVFVNLIYPMPNLSGKKAGLPATTLFRQTFFPPEALITFKDRRPKKITCKITDFEDFIRERKILLEKIIPVEANLFA